MIPREHGAWGILLFSVALGAGVAGRVSLPLLLFTLAALALFLARHPLTLMVKGSNFTGKAILWEAIYVAMAVVAFLPLLFIYHLWWLSLFGIALALYLGAYLYLVVSRKQRTVLGEMIGISGLSMAAPAAYYVSMGVWQVGALYLWLLSYLYHASSIFYVKMKVRQRSLPNLALSLVQRWQLGYKLLLYLGTLIIALLYLGLGGQVSALVFMAYLPLIGKAVWGVFHPTKVASIRALGWTEVAHGFLFTGLAVGVYWLSG